MSKQSDLSPRIPQELLNKIVDDLHDDSKALGCCALTSRLLLERSQTHIFSSIIISSSRDAACHRSRMDANPRLWGYVRRLMFLTFFHMHGGGNGTDVSHILRKATSLRTLHVGNSIAHASWYTIPEDTRIALFNAFRSPSLTDLHIFYLSSLPASIFGLKMHLNHFSLRGLTFCDDDSFDLGSADLSEMSVHTLEISSNDSIDLLLSIIAHPNSFSSRIKKLILHNLGNTTSLAIAVIKSATYSLETIQLLQYPSHEGNMDLPGWAEYDFNVMPYLRRLELHFMIEVSSRETFHQSVTSVVHKIADYFTANPSMLQIKQINVRLVPWWLHTKSSRSLGWHHVLDIVCMISDWSMLDLILAARTTSPESSVAVELGMYKGYEGLEYDGLGSAAMGQEEIHVVKHAWEEKIHAQMPLTSRGGILITDVIPDE
ncbi:hypothetical protein Hypma_002011 [Hypsizygus marmoreus]|uniref:Uncharacterized protein n=1 Tax=Hypsizygus marmoreus TaxID=39966 RepID=A0A369J5R8_HYPMA|nr:hypothetical protein Hypma_002011 [Hypsizygus marmoreus]